LRWNEVPDQVKKGRGGARDEGEDLSPSSAIRWNAADMMVHGVVPKSSDFGVMHSQISLWGVVNGLKAWGKSI
jgi:hypothetical protein